MSETRTRYHLLVLGILKSFAVAWGHNVFDASNGANREDSSSGGGLIQSCQGREPHLRKVANTEGSCT